MCPFWGLNQSIAQVNQKLITELHPAPVLDPLFIKIPRPEAQETRDFYYSVTGKSIPEVLRTCQLLFWLLFLRSTYFYILIFYYNFTYVCFVYWPFSLLTSLAPLSTSLSLPVSLEHSRLFIWSYNLPRSTRPSDYEFGAMNHGGICREQTTKDGDSSCPRIYQLTNSSEGR